MSKKSRRKAEIKAMRREIEALRGIPTDQFSTLVDWFPKVSVSGACSACRRSGICNCTLHPQWVVTTGSTTLA